MTKRFLAILVMLFWCSVGFAEKNTHQFLLDNKLVVLYEGEEWSLQFLPNNKMISEWRGEINHKFSWQKLNDKGSYEINHQDVDIPQYWDINVTDQIFTVTDSKNITATHQILEPKTEKSKKIEIASMIDKAKDTCKSLGFKEGTEKFSDCALKLYSQSVELAAKQNQQIVMQPQSSGSNVMTIYDPVRDSNALMDKGMKMITGRCTLGYNC